MLYVCTCMYGVCVDVYLCVDECVCALMCMCVLMCVSVLMCMRVLMCVYLCVYVCVDVRAGVHSYRLFSNAKGVLVKNDSSLLDPSVRYPPFTAAKRYIMRKLL